VVLLLNKFDLNSIVFICYIQHVPYVPIRLLLVANAK